MKKLLTMFAIVCAFLASCDSEGGDLNRTPLLKVVGPDGSDPSQPISIDGKSQEVAFTVLATADWTAAVVYDDVESADWLTVTPASGTAGEQSVELSATRNYRTSDRTAYVDLACGDQQVRLTVSQAAASGETDFTALFDPDFAKKLQEMGHISDAENITSADMEKIAAITELDVSGTYENRGTLTSLQGIEYFESLTELYCLSNQLTSLDVSANTALTFLECEDNPGDGVSTFPVTAWFDNDTKPDNLEIYQEQWTYGGKTITIEFQKAE